MPRVIEYSQNGQLLCSQPFEELIPMKANSKCRFIDVYKDNLIVADLGMDSCFPLALINFLVDVTNRILIGTHVLRCQQDLRCGSQWSHRSNVWKVLEGSAMWDV